MMARWSQNRSMDRAVHHFRLGAAALVGWMSLALLLSCAAFAQEGGSRTTEPTQPSQAKGQGAAPASDTRFDDALRLHQAGKTDAAIYLLQQVQKDYPNDTRVLFKLGEMAITAKNWAYAIEVLRRAADLRKDDVQARLVLMDVYRAYQMPIQEIMAGREILAIEPRNAEALSRLAHLYEEQAMPDDEEATRRLLAAVAPDDYANQKRLGALLEKMGDTWEAVLVYERLVERFPDKADDVRALARLYGQEGDRYAEMGAWSRARQMPGSGGEVSEAWRHAYFTHKRDLRMFDPFQGDALWQQSVSPVDKIRYLDVRAGYDRLFVTQNSSLGITAHYRDQTYEPLTPLVVGNRGIRSNGAMLTWQQCWGGDQTVLRVRGGYESIGVSGNTVSLNPVVADPISFPFTEARRFGGTLAVGDLTLDHRFNRNFGLRALVQHQPVQDLDAYVRLITRTGGGLGLYYQWPDGTLVEGGYERDHISDNNDRGHATFHFSYPLYMSDPIRDRDGQRVGYLFPVPEHQVRLDYRFENITFKRTSAFYESFPSDNRHTLTLTGQHHIGGRFYFFEEGILGRGDVLQRVEALRAGFVYQDPDTMDSASLTYGTLSELVAPGSQANVGLQGGSRVQGIQLNVVWHFGTGPKVDPVAPPRHK